jgi:tetratricopeptide (TPR) repeat protein
VTRRKRNWTPLLVTLAGGSGGFLLDRVLDGLTNAFVTTPQASLVMSVLAATVGLCIYAIRWAVKRGSGETRRKIVGTRGEPATGTERRAGRADRPGRIGRRRRVPRRAGQLPGRPAPLVGRTRELRALGRSTVDGRVVVLDGAARVGTSALALEAAHRYLDRHRDAPPDAYYLDLRPVDRRPLSATETAAAVLATLDDADDVPEQPVIALGERLAERRVLLVLDNVEHADQVAPLAVPGQGVVLVAGCGIGQLDGTIRVPVEPLSPDAAVELLAAVAGRRELADDSHAASLVRSFGYQPDAIRLLASSIETHERLSDLLHMVRGMEQTEDPAHDFWRSCWLVYDRLPPDRYRLLRVMATMPEVPVGGDSLPVLGAGGDGVLGDLHRRGLLDRDADWYRLPARLVPSLRRHPDWDRYAGDTDRAVRRLVRWYRDAAADRAGRLTGPDAGTAATWFADHEPALFALATHWHPAGTRHRPALPPRTGTALAELAAALCTWYSRAPAGRLTRWYRVALRISRLPGTARQRSWAYTQLGAAARLADQPDRATRWLVRALARRGPRHTNLALCALGDGTDEALYRGWLGLRLRRRRDHAGRGCAMLALGAAYLLADAPDDAGRWFWQAQVDFDAAGDARGAGYALNNRALLLAEGGTALNEAIQYWKDAHAKLEAAQDWPRLVHSLVNRAYAELTIAPATHRHDAVACLEWASRVCRDHGMSDLALLLASFVHRIDPTAATPRRPIT